MGATQDGEGEGVKGEKDAAPDADAKHINLKVLQDGNTVHFKIKKNTPLRKLMSAYCDRCKLAQSTMRFMFDGTRVDETDTPKSMDMEASQYYRGGKLMKSLFEEMFFTGRRHHRSIHPTVRRRESVLSLESGDPQSSTTTETHATP